MAKKMSSHLWAYLAVLLAALVGLAMTPLANAQDTSSPSQTAQDQKTMTATGCLQKAASGNGYQLTDSSSMKTYDLSAASSDVDLSAHVGHTVTVTGTPSAASDTSSTSSANPSANPSSNPSNPSTPGSNPSSSTPGASGSSSNNQQLSVTNVKMVSSSCQAGR
ncbi:MAG TPA: hypothetical protein VN709_13410 [Terriglobales bacterium]|nr:hypothetical protein [Terriglobales bacterium]